MAGRKHDDLQGSALQPQCPEPVCHQHQDSRLDGIAQSEDPRVGDDDEIWPIIYQRAYLDLASSLGQNYHSKSFALSSLLGAATTLEDVNLSLSCANLIKSALESGKAVTAGTLNTTSFFVNSQYGIVHNHAYTILGIEIPNGTDLANAYVSIRNPWGYDTSRDFFDHDQNGSIDWDEYMDWTKGVDGSNDGLIRVSWSAFNTSFDDLAINSLTGINLNSPLPAKSVFFAQPNIGPFAVFEGERLEVNIHATDPDGAFVYYSLVSPSGYIQVQTGAFSWEPPANSAGSHLIRVVAEVSPYESVSMSFVVYVISGKPRIGSLVASPTTLHDDGSDLLTLTANSVVTNLGSINDVEFWRDVDGNQTFDPNIDFRLGAGTKSGNNYAWSGYIGGLAVGNQTFLRGLADFRSAMNSGASRQRPSASSASPSRSRRDSDRRPEADHRSCQG
ncbi:MAG: C2 family cysteine protease [Planctomycetales bacterium]